MGNRFTIAAVLCGLILALAAPATCRDIYIPGDADGLALALKSAERGDRILLAPGHYPGGSLDLAEGVTILGNPDDPTSVVIDATNIERAFRAEGLELARIVGVTITGGNADGATSYAASGGGLFVSSSSVELDRVHFVGNTAHAGGGCVRVSNGHVTIDDCVFVDSNAVKGGGAIDLSYYSSAIIRGSVFRGNTGAWGGAISTRTGSSCWVDESLFANNTAVAPQQLGGAFFADYAAQVAFNNCVLESNTAAQGGAARLGDAHSAFVNCTIARNATWGEGGAFMVRGGSLHLDHSIVAFNQGSALASEDIQLTVMASDIHGNSGGDWIDDLADWLRLDDNLDSDPLFCDAFNLHLQDDSPCAPENSPVGLIGALDADCTDVGIMLQQFQATEDRDTVELTWRVGGGVGYEYRILGRDRANLDRPAWEVAYTATDIPGTFRAVDRPTKGLTELVYTLEARDPDGWWFELGSVTVDRTGQTLPEALTVHSIYPNPFNPRVTIRFSLAERSQVLAAVYDLRGRIVMPLTTAYRSAGEHTLTWDGVAEHGRQAPAGTYILRIQAGDVSHTAKLLMVK